MDNKVILISHFYQEGVGDTPDSYAYDGTRLRKWNVKTFKYGEVGFDMIVYSLTY